MPLEENIEIIEFKCAEAKCSCGWEGNAGTVEYAVLLASEHRLEHEGIVTIKYRRAHSDEQRYVSPR